MSTLNNASHPPIGPNLRPSFQEFWTSLRVASWLGWQIESNWADPFLFAVYSIIKPLASAAILVAMYAVITRSDFESPLFTYMYLGNAFYFFVGQIMNGLSWAVIDDREHYKTLKYIYTAPVHFPAYLIGRGLARFIIAAFSVFIIILAGVLFLDLKIDITSANWPLFFVTLAVGIYMLALMGLALAGIMLLLAHHMWGVGEAVAGALYLFSGAIFPLQVLPAFLRPIGYAMPITYWLELLRRALVGSIAETFPTLSGFSNLEIFGILIGLTAIFQVAAIVIFRWCEGRARELGLIDVVTNY